MENLNTIERDITGSKWIEEHEDNFKYIFDFFGYTKDEVIEFVVEEVNKNDSFDKWNNIYNEQTGNDAKDRLEVITYYEKLRDIADNVIYEFINRGTETAKERMRRNPKSFFERWSN